MTMTTQGAVAGYFADRASAAHAVRHLVGAGFVESEIDLAPYHGPAAGQYAGTTSYHDLNTEFAGAAGSGGALLTVTGPRASLALPILEHAGADLSDGTNSLASEGIQRLQLREEELRARTQTVQAGEVRVSKDVITETRSLDVPVSHDEVVIVRHPVSPHTPAGAPIGQDAGEIRMPLSREEAVLEKQVFVREEVEVGKRQVVTNEHLTDTVRREEARIENVGDVHVEGDTDHRNDMLDAGETAAPGRAGESR